MSDKINLFINTKYTTNPTNSQVEIFIPPGLLKIYQNEYFKMSVNGFYCFSTFHQLTSSNNKFILFYKDVNNNIYEANAFYLTCTGNPNVYNIRDSLNALLEDVCEVEYNKMKNVFIYVRVKAQSNNYNKMYISPVNCGNFLGFNDKDEIEIGTNGIMSNAINVVAHKQLFFNVDGDIQLSENNFNNIRKTSFQPSNIIFYKTVDTGSNQLLVYDNNDSNSSFEYKLSNVENISTFTITIFDQDGNTIDDMPDWHMCIQFQKLKTDDTVALLKQIKEYMSYIFLLIGNYLYPK